MATIVGKIDVTKVDKSKLFEGKNGAKYLDIVLVETPNNRYGDSHMIVQSVSKEERAQGIKGAILGNAKMLGDTSRRPNARPSSAPSDPSPDGPPDDDSSVPF